MEYGTVSRAVQARVRFPPRPIARMGENGVDVKWVYTLSRCLRQLVNLALMVERVICNLEVIGSNQIVGFFNGGFANGSDKESRG
jgi:hypothetical protein